jgi:hypothetical protein
MNKPEILATQGTQDEEKQSKNTIHVYVARVKVNMFASDAAHRGLEPRSG